MVNSVVRVWKAGSGNVISIPQNIMRIMNYEIGDLIEIEFKEPVGRREKNKKGEQKELPDLEEEDGN